MDAFLMLPGARRIVEVCACVQPGERVLVVTDSEYTDIGAVIAGAALERGAEVVMTVMQPGEVDGGEPPQAVAAALKSVDVAIMPVSRSIGHSRAVREAVAAGARVASLSAFTRDQMVRGGLMADFVGLRPRCEGMAARLGAAERAVLTTPAGTNLELHLAGRPGNAHSCILDRPSTFSGIPNIEANIAPLEGVGEGTIVFDGSIPNLRMGVVDAPVVIKVEKGSITDISGGHHARILRSLWEAHHDPSVYTIAQLAVGLNPKCVAFTGVFANDHGAYGTVHIGIGTSANLGGAVVAPMHCDGMMHRPTLLLDGEPVLRNGKVLLDEGVALR